MNYKDALYLAIKYMLDDGLTTQDVVNILQVSNERLKEFMNGFEGF
jgi:hypothetical protein